MRLLMLTQWFAPEPIFKGLPFAKELARRGHEVEVLTGFPNYPGGKVYEGYRVRFFQRENIDGISVIRVPLYPDHGTSAIKRIANYVSFALSAALFGALRVKPADVMYVYHPPATVGFPAALISWLRNIPIVYDIQDLWPDTLAATGMLDNKNILKMVGIWCRFVYRRASRIVVLSPGFKNALMGRGVPSEKIEVIYNWCDETQSPIGNKYAEAELAETLGLADKFNVIFAGTMGKAQSLDSVLDAAALVGEKYPVIQFVFIGGGIEVERLQNRAVQENLGNVKFLPRMDMSEIGAVLQLAELLLVHLRNDPLFRITIPSKTQAYMAAGKPILMGVDGDARDLVDLAGAGVSCSPENPDSIARAVIEFFSLPLAERESMGKRGSEFYRRELSIAAGVEKFEEVFQSVAQGKAGAFCMKQFFDFFSVALGLLLITPLLGVLAIFVRIKHGSPVLFSQARPGLNGKPFTMYKFRTMTDQRDAAGNLLPDEMRLTNFGKFLRSTSLDELPELINVLKGEMSLVGPRPLLMEYLPLYTPEQARRHEVRPGITGWAQVNGRNAISWEEKFKLDVWYVDNQSFWLDIKIFWMTFIKVFKREGISQEGQATAEKFMGSSKEGKECQKL